MPSKERLVAVSNRLPVTLKRSGDGWQTERSSGGLATAMNPILKETGGIWIGWPGEASGEDAEKRQEIIRRWAERDRYIAIDLPPDMARLYYEGYANQTLWPLFHHFLTFLNFSPEAWRAYVAANERFRDAVIERHQPGDLVWVHDYHLMLLPRMLREALPEARIGFFLHIPFPSSEDFRILPRREELLEGLLGADLIAFQAHSHLQHFRASLQRILGMESSFDQVEVGGGRAVRLEGLPIGIAPEEFLGALKGEDSARHRAELDRRFQGRRILLAVDRLDYTKGIPQRLRTFRRLLQNASDLHAKIVLIQVAVPSRGEIATYADLAGEVNGLVGEINGEFSTPDWTPVVYIRRNVPRAQLAALYAAAEIGWVSPLRDGMNLVAKEYVACKPEGDGALVLSEFAGAAAEMGECFVVNPYDEERTAATLERVLSLRADEKRERMLALHRRVLRNNVFAWADRFLRRLREAAESRIGRAAEGPAPLDIAATAAAYRAANRRALFLDYDGTLAEYARRPEFAMPTRSTIELLQALAADPANCVVLVSGRRRRDLETWFGGIDGLWLVAEHGALFREGGSTEWRALRPNGAGEWKDRVREVLDHFVDRNPGSFVEEKEHALVWHFRMADPEFGEWLANELASVLESMLADTELKVARGRKTVEVKPAWANKGDIVERALEACGRPEFRLAVGDDRTDEDMFARLDDDAWTIRVQRGPTRARFFLPSVAAVRALLSEFTVARRAA